MGRPSKSTRDLPTPAELIRSAEARGIERLLQAVIDLKQVSEPDRAFARRVDGQLRLLLEHEIVRSVGDRLLTPAELKKYADGCPDGALAARIRFIIELFTAQTLNEAREKHNDNEKARIPRGWPLSESVAQKLKKAYLRGGIAGLAKYGDAAGAASPVPLDNFAVQVWSAITPRVDDSLKQLQRLAEAGVVTSENIIRCITELRVALEGKTIIVDPDYPTA